MYEKILAVEDLKTKTKKNLSTINQDIEVAVESLVEHSWIYFN